MDGAKLEAQIERDGTIRYSSLDMAILSLALQFVQDSFALDKAMKPAVDQARKINEKADYGQFLDAGTGLLKHGFYAGAADKRLKGYFAAAGATLLYGRSAAADGGVNNEARAPILYLISTGKINESAFFKMDYAKTNRAGLEMLQGYKMNDWVEYMPNVFFDEAGLAPRTFGASHYNHLFAELKIAREEGYRVFGWMPSSAPSGEYIEYGLDENMIANPSAAALMTTIGHAAAWDNLENMIILGREQGYTDRGLQHSIYSRTGEGTDLKDTRELDLAFMYMALNKDAVRGTFGRSAWYGKAKGLISRFDADKEPVKVAAEKMAIREGYYPPAQSASREAGNRKAEVDAARDRTISLDRQEKELRKEASDLKASKESAPSVSGSAYEVIVKTINNPDLNPHEIAAAIYSLAKIGLARNIPEADIYARVSDLLGILQNCQDRTIYEAAARTIGDWVVDGYVDNEDMNDRITRTLLANLKRFSSLNREMADLTVKTLMKVNINEYTDASTSGRRAIEGLTGIITDLSVDPTIRATVIENISVR